MRTGSAVAAMAALAISCGGSNASPPGTVSHPTLDQDYSAVFAGTWDGTATTVAGGTSQTVPVRQPIDRSGFNRLSISQLCPGVAGNAGLDSATSFSVDPMTCAPITQSCGPVTIRYDSGTATIAQGTLTLTLTGNASGCGRSLPFTLTFTGMRTASAPDGGTPDGGVAVAAFGPDPVLEGLGPVVAGIAPAR